MSTPEPDPEKMDRYDDDLRAIYRDIWDLEQKRDVLIAGEQNKELDGIQVSIGALREQARVMGDELDVLVAAMIKNGSYKKSNGL